MAEILKEWLSERLHRCITWEPDGFGDMMKDGQIVAQVLLSYHVINSDQYYAVTSTDSLNQMTQNWKYIRQWLKDIDVQVSEQEINNVLDGQGSALLRLFYKLFLQLDKKDRTEFIKQERQRMSSLVKKLDSRFTTEKVPEDKYIQEDNLARPLYNEKYFIEWQRKKEAEVKDLYEYVRWKHLKSLEKLENSKGLYKYARKKTQMLTPKQKLEMDKFALRYPNAYVNYKYDDLMQMDEHAAQTKTKADTEWTKSYMDTLITKSHRKTHSEDTQNRLINSLTSTLWDEAVNEEEHKLDLELSKKVLKLSQFEKQMCTQIMETKQQARNLAKNRMRAEKEFSEQRENQFSLFLDTVKQQIHSEMDEIDFERNRNNGLHRILFDEKIKRKRQHCYEACYEAVESLIDYVCKVADFLRMLDDDEEIPQYYIHQWKTLFYKMQPVYDIIDPIEDILKTTNIEEEQIPEEEELIKLESTRQGVLNETDFVEYNNYLPPWNLDFLIPNYDADSEDRKFEYLGQNILGHVVYTLLKMKYPYPPRIPPADLPDFPVRAIIRGLPDKSISQSMQILLDLAKIHVVRIESVVNYCLQEFKNEMLGFVEIGISYDSFFQSAKEEDKEFVKELKFDGEYTYGSNIIPVASPNTKQTQTPKALPETEVILSTPAQLGKYAYEALSEGDHMTDSLLATMIVEYLKSKQNDMNGFVVINYPNTYCQAQIMEEVFTGIAPPDENVLENIDDTYLEETIVHHIRKEKDEFKQIRSSKLVRNPHISPYGKNFHSFFSAYIKLIASEDILQEDFAWNLSEENSDLIDRFYASLGMNYSMYYEVVDKGVLSELCRYIIGDVSIPPKSHAELYGEDVLTLLDFPDSYDRHKRSKTFKPDVSSSLIEEISEASQGGQVSSDLIVENEQSIVVDLPQNSEEVKLLAGEEDWVYADAIVPEIIGTTLANCWEEIEKAYINDMEQLFLSKRLTMNVLVPYINFLKKKMDQIINLPSKKPVILAEFQKQYNEYENDWRAIDVVKSEWHCRVQSLQNVLYDICDKRKIFAEQQRNALIHDNFTMGELTSLVNTYISCMQAELNRFILTYQIFHDFYHTTLKGLPPADRLASKELSKIIRESEDPSQKRSGDDKLFKQLKNQFIEMQIKNIEIDFNNNPFNIVIENNVKFALRTIKDVNDSYRAMITKEHTEAVKIGPIKKKDTKEMSPTGTDSEDQKQQNILKCLDEWTMGINGEMFRASLRMVTLQYKCLQDMKLFIDSVAKTFTNIQNSINSHYATEIQCVNNFCTYVKVAIEEGKRIPESLFLENDTFFIDPNVLKLELSQTKMSPEKVPEFNLDFNLSHLAHLRTMFKLCAPTGLILHKSFVYLLQDFILFGNESAAGPLFPEAWKHVDPNKIEKLTNEFYGNAVFIDWRDFLIICLNLKFPNTDELLDMRKLFRCIDVENTETLSRKDFLAESLWFEDYFITEHQLLRLNLIKHFIFELFETSQDRMNYSAFLLLCCKHSSPIDGFIDAISMTVGKKLCYVLEDCEPVIEKLIAIKEYKEACRALVVELVEGIVNELVEKAYIYCESMEISEVQYSDLNIKVKKIKSKSAKKQTENQKPSVEIKNKISTPELPFTYICGPCQAEEEVREIEQMDEICSSASPQEDPSLAYTVSQSVIWKVLKTCLPSYFTLVNDSNQPSYESKIAAVLKKLETDTENGDIYICKFVLDPYICRFLHRVKIFLAHDLIEELCKVYFQGM